MDSKKKSIAKYRNNEVLLKKGSVNSENEERKVSELDAMAKAQSISANSLKNAKADLKKEGKIKYRSEGFNPKRFFVALIATEKTN